MINLKRFAFKPDIWARRQRRGDAPFLLVGNRCRGVATFDLLFCAIPVLLMLNNMLVFSAMAGEKAGGDVEMLTTEGRLLAVSDYVVNYAGVEKEGEFGLGVKYRPNLVDASELETVNREQLGEQMELENLQIGWEAEGGSCIYRLVVYEEEIRKLYFCAD